MFFSLFQMSARIKFRPRITKKNSVFSAQARIELLPIFEKKTFNFGR